MTGLLVAKATLVAGKVLALRRLQAGRRRGSVGRVPAALCRVVARPIGAGRPARAEPTGAQF